MMKQFYASIGFALVFCNTTLYAGSMQDAINQSNSNADRIVAQSQANIIQQQQILAQRLQALSAAMQAQNPDTPIVVQSVPVPVRAVPVQPPVVKTAPITKPPVTSTPNATGLKPSSQNSNNSNQWNYGF